MRRPRWEHTSDVRSERKVVSDGVEHLTLEHGRLLLPQRGGLPLLRLMDQAYDTPNAIGLEIMIGAKEILGIRKIDKGLERKLLGLLRGRSRGNVLKFKFEERVRIVVVIG